MPRPPSVLAIHHNCTWARADSASVPAWGWAPAPVSVQVLGREQASVPELVRERAPGMGSVPAPVWARGSAWAAAPAV